jgi:hypothetical protein
MREENDEKFFSIPNRCSEAVASGLPESFSRNSIVIDSINLLDFTVISCFQ